MPDGTDILIPGRVRLEPVFTVAAGSAYAGESFPDGSCGGADAENGRVEFWYENDDPSTPLLMLSLVACELETGEYALDVSVILTIEELQRVVNACQAVLLKMKADHHDHQ